MASHAWHSTPITLPLPLALALTLSPSLSLPLPLTLTRAPTLPPTPALAHVTSRYMTTLAKMART
jgi:hypothetical protein